MKGFNVACSTRLCGRQSRAGTLPERLGECHALFESGADDGIRTRDLRVGVCVICPVFRLDMSVSLSGCVSTDAFSSNEAFRPAFVARSPLKAAPAPRMTP
jgi:hypothetical protein